MKKDEQPQISVEASVERILNDTARALAAQPKVRVRIPNLRDVPPGKPQPDETVQVNGYTYQIQRGVAVEVPQTVADILEEAGLLG